MIEQFKTDIDAGLSEHPKSLPSKYFYNKIGDALFVKIMHLPEYYLTRSELEIFQQKTKALVQALKLDKTHYFELIELGAGDGLKTRELLNYLLEEGYDFTYMPIDISKNALDQLENSLKAEFTELSIQQQQGDYFKVLESFKEKEHPKVVLFLGSNIGNMEDAVATHFMNQLAMNLKPNDKVLLGVDLIKSKEVVLPAYNDREGVTAAFNLNLLTRINDELDANFDTEAFKHAPEYDEEVGIAKSYLVSTKEQSVRIEALDKQFEFQKDERIFTEISRKYNDAIIAKLLKGSGFQQRDKLVDSKGYFANYVLVKT